LCDAQTKEIQDFNLETLRPLGLRPLKQVEIFKKLQPCLPRQYWEETCQKPAEEMMEPVRRERADKQKIKNNNNAEKNVAKERNQAEAAQKKKKGAEARAHKNAEKPAATT
jgi:hypothetical protein